MKNSSDGMFRSFEHIHKGIVSIILRLYYYHSIEINLQLAKANKALFRFRFQFSYCFFNVALCFLIYLPVLKTTPSKHYIVYPIVSYNN